MAEGRTILGESGVPSKQGQLQFDEIFEETIDIETETIERQEMDKRHVLCDPCFINGVLNVIAFCMCIVCGRHYCQKCFIWHDRSHRFIHSESKDGEREREIDEFVSYMMNDESDDESEKKFWEDDVCVCDHVDTEHGLDMVEKCWITGLTGYEYKWWVVCNPSISCIKVFSLSSNVLQRYIRFGSKPQDVTEIIVENKTTEQDSASCSETAISGTDNKPDRKHLLAVTLQWKRLILILDLGKNPAVIHNKIKTEKYCLSIDFYDGNIYTVCKEPSRDLPYSVYILTVEGVTLKTVQTDVPSSWFSYLTVLNGNIYMADPDNNRVVCYNDEGRVLHQIKIYGSWPVGICVDRSEDKVYISSLDHNKVYELESDLSRYKSVLDQTSRYMSGPHAMCFYSDKLYVGHFSLSKSRFHVTVVRLL